ncbi:hypothetical protein [Methanobrevibacter sp.]|uniref:hypothetical protein n=1 Tax=Methanobrevibacter sp. TaxID=66852 RepID=UPI00388D5673
MINGTDRRNYINFENRMYKKFFGLSPNMVSGQQNYTNYYKKRYMYNKIYSVFDFKLLDSWSLRNFRYCLFHFGSVAIFKKNGGWTWGSWSVKEWDTQMSPKLIHCHNLLNQKDDDKIYTVGVDAIIVSCFDDYIGWDDLVREHSEFQANCIKTEFVALENANVNLYATVKSKKQKTQLEQQWARGTKGQPMVFIDEEDSKDFEGKQKDEILKPWTNHDTLGALGIIQQAKRNDMNEFLTEIGIRNANTQKKERLISDEVNQNNEETSANVTICYNNIKEAFDIFNSISGLSQKLSVDLHYDYENEDNIEVSEGGEE